MHGEYGYMEEGHLGKPYNLKLLKRLSKYARPYRNIIIIALALSMLITLLDLCVPYLSKIAIDRYIISKWYKIFLAQKGHILESSSLNEMKKHTIMSLNGKYLVISHSNLKRLDPQALYVLKKRGLISPSAFYLIRAKTLDMGKEPFRGGLEKLSDGSFLIKYDHIKDLPEPLRIHIRKHDLIGVAKVASVLLGILFVTFILSYFEYYLLEYTGQHIMQDIRVKLFQNIQSQSIMFFDKHPVGRLVTRVTNDVENLNEMFKSVVITLFKDFFIVVGILAVLLYLNWKMAIVCFVLLPLIFVITFLFSSLAREAFRELRAKVAKINAFLQERISNMTTIQIFCAEKAHMKQFEQINHENFLAGMRQIKIFALFMPLMELFSSFAVALVIWYGGGKVIQDRVTIGALVAFISYIQMFFKPIRDISEKYNIMQSAMASTERIFQFMDADERIPEPHRPVVPQKPQGHVSLQHVYFSYEKNRPVLKNISFEVRPGQTVAIVGHTGSGKSTIVNLIERFYDPDKGTVIMDQIDIKLWPQGLLHRQIGLVMQDVFVLAGTLAENISLGREGIDKAVIEDACRRANLTPFIEKYPEGLDHRIGEGGSTLSTGQRQLLSFARALAGNPSLLILDEATSSVDPDTERLIQEAISHITAERTTLVIAHRLSTIEKADRIIVIHKGQIREQGTHDELIAKKGIYYKLRAIQ